MDDNKKYYDPFAVLDGLKTKSGKSDKEKVGKTAFLVSKDNGDKVAINKKTFTVGKNQSCNYIINNNKTISKVHVIFTIQNNKLFITDNNSTNKTYLNKQLLSPGLEYQVNNGDEIIMSNMVFTLTIE